MLLQPAVSNAMRQFLLLVSISLLLLSTPSSSSNSTSGDADSQHIRWKQHFNVGWTVRGYCTAAFLGGFAKKLGEATAADIQGLTKATDVQLVTTSACQEIKAVRCYHESTPGAKQTHDDSICCCGACGHSK